MKCPLLIENNLRLTFCFINKGLLQKPILSSLSEAKDLDVFIGKHSEILHFVQNDNF